MKTRTQAEGHVKIKAGSGACTSQGTPRITGKPTAVERNRKGSTPREASEKT